MMNHILAYLGITNDSVRAKSALEAFIPYAMLLTCGIKGLYVENKIVILFNYLEKFSKTDHSNVSTHDLCTNLGWSKPFAKIVKKLRNFIVHGNGAAADCLTMIKTGEMRRDYLALPEIERRCFDLGPSYFYHLIEIRVKNSILKEIGLDERLEFCVGDVTFTPE